jgi:hypothetical protein
MRDHRLKAGMQEDFASRIRAVALLGRRDRFVLELVCIDWELSHFAPERRVAIEAQLSRAFAVPAFGRLLEDSVRGHVTGREWVRLFRELGL